MSGSCQQAVLGICNSVWGCLCSTICLYNSFHGYFVPPSKKD
uniref:Uncharacterized protein n=1 Tax=Trichinella nativa TaxID=6335 RepID=A0A0V1KHX1_9BILA